MLKSIPQPENLLPAKRLENTGTFTVMTQIAADELGLPIDDVLFGYGDSRKLFLHVSRRFVNDQFYRCGYRYGREGS
jgi:hypothetical protein